MSNEAWEKLARRKCGTCGPYLGNTLISGKPVLRDACPDCQGIGLELPELSRPCNRGTCRYYSKAKPPYVEVDPACVVCHGTGRVLLSGDLLLVAGERALTKQGAWDYSYSPDCTKGCHQYYLSFVPKPYRAHYNPGRLAALLAALEALVEVER